MPQTKFVCEPSPVTGIVSPFEHYALNNSTECQCALCVAYWMARDAMARANDKLKTKVCNCALCKTNTKRARGQRFSAAHHVSCRCVWCEEVKATTEAFMAAQNRRDIWVEMSYHATHDEEIEDGRTLMAWLADELSLARPRWSEQRVQFGSNQLSWWGAPKNMRFTMGNWIDQFKKAATAGLLAVTGANTHTFRVSMGL